MIIVINLCKNGLHFFEFVKPIVDIIERVGLKCEVMHVDRIDEAHIKDSERAIICGTSLLDSGYQSRDFSWIKKYEKPLLGICAGFHMICKAHGFELEKDTSIGLEMITFEKGFLGANGEQEVYSLHNNVVKYDERFPETFEMISVSDSRNSDSRIIQAIKKKDLETYGMLFHPEVRNKAIIEKFLYI